jgi:hypothetical protein
LISNYHVVKDATKVRLLTSAGLIDAKVVSVDAANDLALLKAKGKYSSLPIAASRTASLGSTMASVGFPNTGLQGFAPKLAKGEIASLSGVLLVEAGAQVAGMVAQEDPANPSLPRLKLTALRGVKIFGSARPGETLIIEATITGRLGLMVQAKVSASVSGVKVMTAELTLSGTAAAGPAGAQSARSAR